MKQIYQDFKSSSNYVIFDSKSDASTELAPLCHVHVSIHSLGATEPVSRGGAKKVVLDSIHIWYQEAWEFALGLYGTLVLHVMPNKTLSTCIRKMPVLHTLESQSTVLRPIALP